MAEVPEKKVGWVKAKMVGMGKVCRIVWGHFGETLEDSHLLVAAIANSQASSLL